MVPSGGCSSAVTVPSVSTLSVALTATIESATKRPARNRPFTSWEAPAASVSGVTPLKDVPSAHPTATDPK